MAHAVYRSKRRKEKEANTGIGIRFCYVEDAEALSKCPTFGEVDENGGVKGQRRIYLSFVSGENEKAYCDVEAPNRLHHGTPVKIAVRIQIDNSTD